MRGVDKPHPSTKQDRVVLFPGVTEISAPEPDFDFEDLLGRQSDLLARWRVLGEEIRRRVEHPLPFDLALELRDLIDETNA